MREEILRFPIDGRPTECVRLAGGRINDTYLVTTSTGERYVLQRLNPLVYTDAGRIMRNARVVGRFFGEAPGERPGVVRYMPCSDGSELYRDGEGGAWRAYRFVPGCACLNGTARPEDIYECARAFGGFVGALSALPAEELYETVEDFHNTPVRIEHLKAALAAAGSTADADARELAAFAISNSGTASMLMSMSESGVLPRRATHNDTKLSNVLLDPESRRAVCILDLDTVMPGLTAWDFGDLVRSGAAKAQGGGCALELEYYRFAVRGYLESCSCLTAEEKAALPLGVFTMALECGVRYLTDALSGGGYLGEGKASLKLERARSQLSLARDALSKLGEMERIAKEEEEKIKTVM